MAGIYEQIKCKVKRTNIFNPTVYQSYVINYFVNISTFKGLLLYHKLGAGKTCTSVLIADQMIRLKKIKRVFILTPGSLRVNWIDEYCKKCGSNFISQNFIFMTYNSNLKIKLNEYDFNNSLIIIDEAHNVINGVKNMSVNSLAIYRKIYESNCRVLLLTGTPIIQYTWEWSLMGNLLNPNGFLDIIDNKAKKINPIFPINNVKQDENYKGIISYYPGDPTLYPTIYYKKPIKCVIDNKHSKSLIEVMETEKMFIMIGPPKLNEPNYMEKYQRYIRSIKRITSRSLSNVNYEHPYIVAYKNLEKYPQILDILIENCQEEISNLLAKPIDSKILKLRLKAYNAEVELAESIKRFSNFKLEILRRGFYDTMIEKLLDLNTEKYKKHNLDFFEEFKTESELIKKLFEKRNKYLQKLFTNYNIFMRFKGEIYEMFYKRGAQDGEDGEDGEEGEEGCEQKREHYNEDDDDDENSNIFIKFSSKWIEDELFYKNYPNLLFEVSKKYTALFVNIVSNLRTKHVLFSFFKTGIGFEMIAKLLDKAQISYGIFSGDINDKERRRIIEVFNSPENRNGEIMNVLMLTEAGAEGISLLETNNMHILESSTREHKITQAIGRVARIFSHINMPKNRQYVNIWRYWSTIKSPQSIKLIDELLYDNGVLAEEGKNLFFEKLIENSIEKGLPAVMPPPPTTYKNILGEIAVEFKNKDFVRVLMNSDVYAFLPMTTSTINFPEETVNFLNHHSIVLPQRRKLENNWATLETRNEPGTFSIVNSNGINYILAYIQQTNSFLAKNKKINEDPLKNTPPWDYLYSEQLGDRILNLQNVLENVVRAIPVNSKIVIPKNIGTLSKKVDEMNPIHNLINHIALQYKNKNIKFIFYN